MSDSCFWILNDGGSVVRPNSRHILAVTAAPQPFGETLDSIAATFTKFGEHPLSNVESKARQEVLQRVLGRNHIRIRKNNQARRQHWSVQLYKLSGERRRVLAVWACYISMTGGDTYADVIIHQLCDNSKIQTSLHVIAEFRKSLEPLVVRIYSQEELGGVDCWHDYAHTLDPRGLSPMARRGIDQYHLDTHLHCIKGELVAEIKQQYVLDWHGIHGICHLHRVYKNGMRLGTQEGVNLKVVQFFALFHDSRRNHDGCDSGHGKRGAELALKLRRMIPLNDQEMQQLVLACKLHTSARTHEDITIQVCFDCDRLDLGRVGNYPDRAYLSSPLARNVNVIKWCHYRSLHEHQLPPLPFGLVGYDHLFVQEVL